MSPKKFKNMSNLKGWGLIKIADKNSVTHVSHKCTSNLGTSSRGCFFKNTFLKILQNFKGKHLCWSLFFLTKLHWKKRLQHRFFLANFANILTIRFWENTSGGLLLKRFVQESKIQYIKMTANIHAWYDWSKTALIIILILVA